MYHHLFNQISIFGHLYHFQFFAMKKTCHDIASHLLDYTLLMVEEFTLFQIRCSILIVPKTICFKNQKRRGKDPFYFFLGLCIEI